MIYNFVKSIIMAESEAQLGKKCFFRCQYSFLGFVNYPPSRQPEAAGRWDHATKDKLVWPSL